MRRIRHTDAPPPDAQALRAAALAYLARYAATEAGLTRVLARKVDRWARGAEGDGEAVARDAAASRAAIPGIVAALAQGGAVSDAAFAQSRARALARAGKSRHAIAVALAQRGVPEELARAHLPDEEAALAGALIHARRRRIGPWRKGPPAPETARRELASLARAGFAQSVARRALSLDADGAESLIAAFRAAL